MPIAFPVSEILDEAIEILGNCNKAKLYTKITRAVEVLANKGEWDILTKQVDICALSDGCTVTMPRDVMTILAVNNDGRPMFARNKWYEFHYNGSGSGHQVPWAWDNQELTPVFMDIIKPSPLIAIADLKTDLGAQIRIFGYDQNGKWIRSQLPDGTWIDGFYMVINLLSDYPLGIITPDTTRRFIRNFVPTPVTDLLSGVAHDLTTGAAVVLSLINPPLPTPLVNGGTYYVRVVDSTHVSLHSTPEGALTDSVKIALTSVNAATILSLTDRRDISVLTEFFSATKHNQRDGMVVKFSGTAMPSPIVAGTSYFSHVVDDNNFTVHASIEEAQANINPIDVTTPGTAVVASASQDITAITNLNFTVNHDFTTGDAVQVVNSGGQLPTPLLPNTTYYVRYVTATRVTIHSTQSDSTTGANPIVLLSSGTGPSTLVKTTPCSVNVGTSNNINCTGHGLTQRSSIAPINTVTRERTTNVAKLFFATPHGFATGDVVNVSSMSDATYNTVDALSNPVNVPITVTSTLSFTYVNIGVNEANTPDVAGVVTKYDSGGDLVQFTTSGTFPLGITQGTTYRAEPAMTVDTFTIFDTSTNVVNVQTPGSGQLFLVISRVFTIGFTSDWVTVADKITTGDVVRFDSTGNIPSTSPQINNATNYFARKIDATTVELFTTLALATDTSIRQSASRSRTGNVATITTSANHGFLTGDFVDISGLQQTDNGVLQTAVVNAGGAGYVDGESVQLDDGSNHRARAVITVAAGAITFFRITDGGSGFANGSAGAVIGGTGAAGTWKTGVIANGVQKLSSAYNATRVQITFTGVTTFTYTSVGLNEPTTADTGGSIVYSDIKVNALGSGSLSLIFNRSVTPVPASSLLRLSSNLFLEEGAIIRFETDGTLPAPLALATDYVLSLDGGFLKVFDTLNNQIILTTIGSGNHDMVIARNFTTPIPTSFIVTSNNYNDGDKVKGETTGTLPSPLIVNTDYYIRRLDDDTIELYDTAAHAIATPATTGRISPVNTGSGTNTLVEILDALQIQRITRVVRSATNGFMKVYAWDVGRSNALTLVGDYFPDETEPLYRRIKLKLTCQWVRIAFKQNVFAVVSDTDLIPIPSKMAVLMMLKALQLYGTEFSEDAAKFESDALRFLSEAQASLDGPDSPTMQVNDSVTTNPSAQRMDTGWGFYGPF